MTVPAPCREHVAEVLEGPVRVGSEQRWQVRLPDGRKAVFGRLLPELARDEALRRRYLRDVRRTAGMRVAAVAEVVAHGPAPEDPSEPPWRLRVEPEGESLEDWLVRRAPAPIEEVARVGIALAEALEQVHRAGAVIRDLHPRNVVLHDHGVRLRDVGLARLDLLSTRTAASLVLEGSPYAAPEALRRTALDQRADLYSLGVILWRASIGALPHGDELALLRDDWALPSVSELRPDVPAVLAELLHRCLSADPDRRPGSAAEVARLLRGEGSPERNLAKTACQHCGAVLRVGQRLCVVCGRQAVRYEHAPPGAKDTVGLELTRVKETAEYMGALRRLLGELGRGPVPKLNFLVGDQRMYSKEELSDRIRLPVLLFDHLERSTAETLAEQFQEAGLSVRIRETGAKLRKGPNARTMAALKMSLWWPVWSLMAGWFAFVVLGFLAFGFSKTFLIFGSIMGVAVIGSMASHRSRSWRVIGQPPLARLRAAPAALPASDPWVARLAALIDADTPPDVRECVGELALRVQNLVDHRARLEGGDAKAELDMVAEPIEPLLELLEQEIGRLQQLDARLQELDEGALVRALARFDHGGPGATDTERETLLQGLDRLRALEEQRAACMHRLLEASSLLRRAVELGLEVQDPAGEHARHVQLALATLRLQSTEQAIESSSTSPSAEPSSA